MNHPAATRTLVFLLTEDWFFASHFLARAQAARAAGWRVILIAGESEAAARLHAAGIELIAVDFSRRRLNPLAELRLALQLARLYRRLKPDVAHHIALKPIIIGGLAARLAGVRAIVNAPTGLGFVFSSTKPLAKILRPFVTLGLRLTLSPKGAKVIFENPDDMDYLTAARMLRPGAAVLIPGAGVNLDEFSPAPPPPGAIRVILIARMIRAKGIATFCEAARLLRGQAEFILVGAPDPGNPDSIPAAELRAWADEGILTWLGPRSDIAALLGGAHIACQPSTYGEGLPKSALEAMAAGRPLAASNIPGLREAVVDGQTGILIPPGDAPALAAALAKLIASPALRARMGAAARARAAEKFSEPRICTQTLLVYEALISGAPP